MSDIRFDPVSAVWVAIARNRNARPMEYIPIEPVRHKLICPFCAGNEEETPESIGSFDQAGQELRGTEDASGWTIRLIPNKFPSLQSPASVQLDKNSPYCSRADEGIQEILIPSPRHVTSLSELSDVELEVAFEVARTRVNQLYDSANHVMMFMNCGLNAGASLGHIHLQLMGSPVTSPFLQNRVERIAQYERENSKPMLQNLAEWESQSEIRLVEHTRNFVVFCPYASRFAFQLWVVPRDAMIPFSNLPPDQQIEVANLLRKYVTRLESILDTPSYNLLLHDIVQGSAASALGISNRPWFFELFPRITRAAGFELGTDIWVNPVPPELAAKRYRA